MEEGEGVFRWEEGGSESWFCIIELCFLIDIWSSRCNLKMGLISRYTSQPNSYIPS